MCDSELIVLCRCTRWCRRLWLWRTATCARATGARLQLSCRPRSPTTPRSATSSDSTSSMVRPSLPSHPILLLCLLAPGQSKGTRTLEEVDERHSAEVTTRRSHHTLAGADDEHPTTPSHSLPLRPLAIPVLRQRGPHSRRSIGVSVPLFVNVTILFSLQRSPSRPGAHFGSRLERGSPRSYHPPARRVVATYRISPCPARGRHPHHGRWRHRYRSDVCRAGVCCHGRDSGLGRDCGARRRDGPARGERGAAVRRAGVTIPHRCAAGPHPPTQALLLHALPLQPSAGAAAGRTGGGQLGEFRGRRTVVSHANERGMALSRSFPVSPA